MFKKSLELQTSGVMLATGVLNILMLVVPSKYSGVNILWVLLFLLSSLVLAHLPDKFYSFPLRLGPISSGFSNKTLALPVLLSRPEFPTPPPRSDYVSFPLFLMPLIFLQNTVIQKLLNIHFLTCLYIVPD